MRSHLGAFSGDLPEGESIMEGFYINTIAFPMKVCGKLLTTHRRGYGVDVEALRD